jgi:hypothetical protein
MRYESGFAIGTDRRQGAFHVFSPGETTSAGRDETAVIAKPLGNEHAP